MFRFKNVLVIIFSCFALACSGGGGGGSGSASSNASELKRNSDTAVRVVHAGIDATPVSIKLDGSTEYLDSARFAQTTFYQKISSGPATVVVERVNTPGATVASFSQDFAANTEYTIFLYGEAGGSGLKTEIFQDVVIRPESGFSLVNFYNGYIEDSISVTVAGASIGKVGFGGVSEFVQTASGPQIVTVTNSSGQVLANVTLDLPDRGDASILIAGSSFLGVTLTPLFRDLD